jgi:hypothetical protein
VSVEEEMVAGFCRASCKSQGKNKTRRASAHRHPSLCLFPAHLTPLVAAAAAARR